MLKPVLVLTLCLAACGAASHAQEAASGPRPNVLWLTCEDMSPQIGPYGDAFADTPNLDRFAKGALRYRTVWSNAPVCAPARTTLISGIYPPATGSEHMRSMTRLPAGFRMYPQFLREAGYYCTNNPKEDYNLEKPGKVWDESSNRAHWKSRAPGQPFFAVFNFQITHESQLRTRPHTWVHDPAKVRLPAYHPDTPEVRQDWAQSYDNITEMDRQFGARLKELEDAGLAEDTIVFFYSDHGSGMPRSKRWPYNSGLQVPLLVRVPEKYRALAPRDYAPGGTTDRKVAFIDFAPTLLSLVGIRPPAWMQGHAFMGRYDAPSQPYLYGFRGRMDERYDLVRSVRDDRFVYIRNYMPHRIYGQHLAYMFETPTTSVWKRLYDEGKLKPPQTYFWEKKPVEELYDLQADPDEVHNLAAAPEHRATLERLREVNRKHLLEIRDAGFLPEGEIHRRSAGSTPYEMSRDPQRYPVERVLAAAELASSGKDATPELKAALKDPDSAVRYWAATGFLVRERAGVAAAGAELRAALADESPFVRIAAAEALGRFGSPDERRQAIAALGELVTPAGKDLFVALALLNAVDALGKEAASLLPQVKALGAMPPPADQRMREYVPRLAEDIGS